jgi:hypothetical protein
VNTARTCAPHMPVPSTSDTARAHPPRATHGAHHPSGSPGAGSVMPGSSATRHHRRMPWDKRAPRAAKYGRDHRTARAAHMTALRARGEGVCAEPVCVMRSRRITPDMQLHLAHDPTGTVVLGLAHARCNTREAAVRGNRLRYHPTPTPGPQSRLRW